MFNYDIPAARLLAAHSTVTTTITMTITTVKMTTTVVINISMTTRVAGYIGLLQVYKAMSYIITAVKCHPPCRQCLDDDKCDIIDNKVRHG